MSEEQDINAFDLDILGEIRAATKYVCRVEDLDRPLNNELREKFQSLFPDPATSGTDRAWRMYYQGSTPRQFLARYGIDFDHPTVRDAVAFDLVKLDDGTVSNDSVYTYPEHIGYSQLECERMLLNRNFRISLVNLEPEWSSISYAGRNAEANQFTPEPGWREEGEQTAESRAKRRTVERVYQGARLSETLLGYFKEILDQAFNQDGTKKGGFDIGEIYVPFTNANDFTTEVSLIPNTHPDFRAITSRAYYDTVYIQYRNALRKHNITAIATFAEVDPQKDKNHTGKFLVKVQRKISDTDYRYVVAKIDVNGQLIGEPYPFSSGDNTILCVCGDDFLETRTVTGNLGAWTPEMRDIPMVRSTTSSHYSIFRQRVPEYDLKEVRHYFQFKNRLEGMELCLKNLKMDVYRKEVRASECFAKETMVIDRLFKEFSKNRELMELVIQYYDLVHEWDELVVKRRQLVSLKDEKLDLLEQLTGEYRTIPNSMMDRKIELGEKIKSIKLELDRSVLSAIKAVEGRMNQIYRPAPNDDGTALKEINDKIAEIQTEKEIDADAIREVFGEVHNVFTDAAKTPGLGDDEPPRTCGDVKDRLERKMHEILGRLQPDQLQLDSTAMTQLSDEIAETISGMEHDLLDSSDGSLWNGFRTKAKKRDSDFVRPGDPYDIKTEKLHALVLQSERWRGFMLNLGYELHQLKQMETICEDQTIKVRRLVHNFEEKMERVEKEVWDEDHELRKDFSFTGISTASLKEIILLHDWYAANAPGKTAEEMGFKTDEEFIEFRKKCNKVSYNLRKNQYAQLLAVKKDRLDSVVKELRERIENVDVLHYKDKYGWEAKKEQDALEEQKEWSLSGVGKEKVVRAAVFAEAERVLGAIWDTGQTIPAKKGSDLKVYAEVEAVMSRLSSREPMQVPQTARADLAKYAVASAEVARNEADSRQYAKDSEMLVERTLAYLKNLGLAETEDDIEALLVRNRTAQYEGDVYAELNIVKAAKDKLDSATSTMQKQRDSMKSTIESVTDAELRILDLERENKSIFNACLYERNKQARNRLLINKMENESSIIELKGLVKRTKAGKAYDFSVLDRMKGEVDELQKQYDSKVSQFKQKIGLNQEAMDRLMVGIYNRFQDEILNGAK